MSERTAIICGVASWIVEAALQLSGVQSIALACVLLIAGSGLFVYAALQHFKTKPKIGAWISVAIVTATGGTIWFLASHSINGGAPIWTNTVGVNNGINAPGATGTINQYNNVPPPLPNSEIEQMEQLDAIFAGRDENELRIFFGFPELVVTNIELYKQKRLHPDAQLFPDYLNGRALQLDRQWAPKDFNGDTVKVDGNTVTFILLPVIYVTNKKQLLRFENSSLLPVETTYAVKEFDRALETNVIRFQAVLNIAMREDPNYFILHDKAGSKFAFVIANRYWSQFEQLRPLADKIRDSTRAALRSHDVSR
jgi:hypothetical protein